VAPRLGVLSRSTPDQMLIADGFRRPQFFQLPAMRWRMSFSENRCPLFRDMR